MISITQMILGFFGYVKIPREAIQISTYQEVFLEKIISKLRTIEVDEDTISLYSKMLEGQKTLTRFLRSGRFLSA